MVRSLMATLPVLLVGCMSPVTNRLDQMNAKLSETNEQLAVVSNKLDETNLRMVQLNAKLCETNRQLMQVNGQMGEMNTKLGSVDTRFMVMDQKMGKMVGQVGTTNKILIEGLRLPEGAPREPKKQP